MIEIKSGPLGVELLDDPEADPRVVEESLGNIARANRWFGGRSALCYGLRRALRDVSRGETLVLLDIGTGLGDLPSVAVRWGAAHGLRIVAVGLERNRTAAFLASSRGLPTVFGCAGAVPIRAKGVDVVTVSQVAHHLSTEAVIRLFRECNRLARRAVVISDLRRADLATLAYHCGARLLRFDPVTLSDGLTSIRRGYTLAEFSELLRRAGISGEVHQRPGFRLVATWRPDN